MIVRRKALEEVGLLDERFFFYGEDTDWCKRYFLAGWGIMFYSEAEAVHYGGSSTTAEPVKYCIEKEKADLQYWMKHHSKADTLLFMIIKVINHLLYGISWGLLSFLKTKRKKFASLKAKGHFACLFWLFSERKGL